MGVKNQDFLLKEDSSEFNLFQELEDKKNIKKAVLRKINIDEMPEKLPNFRDHSKTKDAILSEWLIDWINEGIKGGKLCSNELLPSKNEIASRTGVSIGTVQTAIRIIEDLGYVASKQRIGTFICDTMSAGVMRKQFSKRELTIENIKKYIVNGGYYEGEELPSSRTLSKEIGSAPNTTRLALEYLAKSGVIQSKASKGNKSNWILNILPELAEEENASSTDSLVDQVERDMKALILKSYKPGDKLLSHYELSDSLKVSIKTIHDAIKRLVGQGILQAKRGRYGTYILRMPSEGQIMTGKESEIFAPATQASLYNYERVEKYLKNYIKDNFNLEDKLPSMSELAETLSVSSNTVRKALQTLSDEGIVRFSRGRYGGTFLVKVPEIEKELTNTSFTWISVNNELASVYEKRSK